MSMAAGRLRHKIEIQQHVIAQDPSTGAELPSIWVAFASVRAAVEPLSARDLIAAQAGQSEATGRMVIRYRVGVLPTMRIIFRGEIYSIQGPPLADPVSGLEYLTILVAKGVSDG